MNSARSQGYPLSRAAERVLTLAARPRGYVPVVDGPWWAWFAPWVAHRLVTRLATEGALIPAGGSENCALGSCANPDMSTVTRPIAVAQIVSMQDQDDIHPEAAIAPGYLANHAARAFNRGVDAALKAHGLTMALVGPLLLLSWKGPLLQRDIVRSSAVRQPAMVALLDKLEAMRLIARVPSLNDRRASLVDLTEAGRDAARIGRDALVDGNIRGLEGFSPEEAGQLVALLQRLINNLDRS